MIHVANIGWEDRASAVDTLNVTVAWVLTHAAFDLTRIDCSPIRCVPALHKSVLATDHRPDLVVDGRSRLRFAGLAWVKTHGTVDGVSWLIVFTALAFPSSLTTPNSRLHNAGPTGGKVVR